MIVPSGSRLSKRKVSLLALAGLLASSWFAQAAAEPAKERSVIFYIDDVEFLDLAEMGNVLKRNGAEFTVMNVPFGRASHLLETDMPGCGFILAKDLPGRSDYHWLAPTLLSDVVIASSDPAAPEPQPGDMVATFGAQGFLNLLAEFGYKPLLYRTMAQGAKLLETGRARYIIGIEPSLWPVEKALGHPLVTVKALHHMDIWLGCNRATSPESAAAIGKAWKAGLQKGEIQQIYQSAGLTRFLPNQD